MKAQGEKPLKYIASCSFGKDSIATVLLALEHGEPLDGILYCEVMFDENISAEVPEHKEFIYNVAIPYFERVGVKTEIVRGKKTFVELFNKVVGAKGTYAGKIWSWPLCGRCYVQRDCKARPLDAYKKAAWGGRMSFNTLDILAMRTHVLQDLTEPQKSRCWINMESEETRRGQFVKNTVFIPRFMSFHGVTDAFSVQMQKKRS